MIARSDGSGSLALTASTGAAVGVIGAVLVGVGLWADARPGRAREGTE